MAEVGNQIPGQMSIQDVEASRAEMDEVDGKTVNLETGEIVETDGKVVDLRAAREA